MTRKERIAIQRVMALEAIAKLRSIEEYFGVEDERGEFSEYLTFSKKVDELKAWLFNESPIA